jgi:pyruvate/2-oxoglutarate dehydrogenase complex dihydrolipoamide dehydrogenase (E3) component
MSDRYDAVVIGTGQAGTPLAARAAKAGWRVAIVERHLLGGTCVNAGCIPTKALVASARAVHLAGRGDEFGFAAGAPIVDMPAVKARMKRISGRSNSGVTRWIESLDGVDLVRGHAVFDGPNRVVVGDRVLEPDRVFINVGARPRVPDFPGIDEVDYLTSTSILDLEEVPDHLIVIGGSYIGLEFAQVYRRFGAKVTIVEKSARLVSREDPDVSAAVQEVLESAGIEVRLNAECIGFASHPTGVATDVACSDGPPQIVGSHLLLAVGRAPNTDDLGLETTDVGLDDRGMVVVDDQLRTGVEGIWALGDCNGRGAFTHTSYNDYEIVAANLFDNDPRRVTDRIDCYALYIDPPLGRVGMTEAQARESGRNVLIGTRPMKHVGRAYEMGETAGFMKFLVDADTDEILGGSIFGINGDEVIHSVLDVMYSGAPYTTISRAVHIHPTVTELVPTTLQDLRPLDEAHD